MKKPMDDGPPQSFKQLLRRKHSIDFPLESSHLHTPHDQRTFVFGSNERGFHGAGAAYYAFDKLGAVWGRGEGPSGAAYALPTCSMPGAPLPLERVRHYVDRFLLWARSMPESRLFVSEVGCGLAGHKVEDIAPLFANAPVNCDLPPTFLSIIGR